VIIMIKFVVEKEMAAEHKVLCPHCKEIIALRSAVQLTEIPGGLALSVKLSAPPPKTLQQGVRMAPLPVLEGVKSPPEGLKTVEE
jgi:hypothetical protein